MFSARPTNTDPAQNSLAHPIPYMNYATLPACPISRAAASSQNYGLTPTGFTPNQFPIYGLAPFMGFATPNQFQNYGQTSFTGQYETFTPQNPAEDGTPSAPVSLSNRSPSPSPPPPPSTPKSRKMYTCNYQTPYSKDMRRHKATHATSDQRAYRCRCGHTNIRKDNYLRHTESCNRERVTPFYVCKCVAEYSAGKEEHISHVEGCSYGFGNIGRPSVS
ncbi:hypothetical protein GQX73_g3015 [Xylaria multiplex]|uniref:Uncharacterized protein n=1 Tax=Xylaria multiplex TaxID=323545 RepID=A0A7C8NAD6_9PEZI|nr:hypothetical protein GQX73_g3015 [Xylaria multiplex]